MTWRSFSLRTIAFAAPPFALSARAAPIEPPGDPLAHKIAPEARQGVTGACKSGPCLPVCVREVCSAIVRVEAVRSR
ncbi:hypothetical protein B2G71_01310 [Novosphingobium sp. PC22D]|uniref:hypothetical protein n=1 Tax=Novosphingobium sp. PC22D TaxID=1962403 RepID=UPI000BEF92CB|nr:hypothetical protein [Novosphingobium sp. PC22D]PEQ14273.1 hypothetical protein B2G71_01310 [Novosphingobium sp. PC22D]